MYDLVERQMERTQFRMTDADYEEIYRHNRMGFGMYVSPRDLEPREPREPKGPGILSTVVSDLLEYWIMSREIKQYADLMNKIETINEKVRVLSQQQA
jgi:hypothetical protein